MNEERLRAFEQMLAGQQKRLADTEVNRKGGTAMKKLMNCAMLVLLAAMLGICACADAGERTSGTVIRPQPLRLRMDQLAGRTVLVRAGAYSEAEARLTLTVLEKLHFAAEDVEGLQPGDALEIDGELLEVQRIDPGLNAVFLGEAGDQDEGVFWLEKGEDGDYYAGYYARFIWQTVGSADFAFAKDMQLLDGIDPETGEMPDTPTVHDMNDFLRMKQEEERNGYPGFACDNVWATFDADGNIALLERFYVPWQ